MQLLLHPCQSRQKYPAAMNSAYFRQVRSFKTISAGLGGLLHSCLPLGHIHPPHPLQKMLIFRQLLYCTALPHDCLCPSGRIGGRSTQLWRAEESTFRLGWAAGEWWKLPWPRKCGAALRGQQQSVKGETHWDVSEAEQTGMHGLSAVRLCCSGRAPSDCLPELLQTYL